MTEDTEGQGGGLVPSGEQSLARSPGMLRRGLALAKSLAQPPVPARPPGEVRVYRGHAGAIYSVALSPDGKRALSAGRDGTLRLWDVEAGRELLCLAGHPKPVETVALSPDGRWALSGSWDTTLRLWALESGDEVRCFAGCSGSVTSAVFSPDGSQVLAGSHDSASAALHLWETETGREIRRLPAAGHQVECVAFSPDGERILSGGRDGSVRLWSARDGRALRRLPPHRGIVWGAAFSPGGGTIATASGGRLEAAGPDARADCSVRLSDAGTGEALWQADLFRARAAAVAFLPDAERLVCAGDTGLRVLRTADGRETGTLGGHGGLVSCVAVLPDGLHALTGSWDCTLRLWRLPD